MSNRCYLVAAYCDTLEKEKALISTLNTIKKYELDIILFSHYPIPSHIFELVDHAIYDYSNPIIVEDERCMMLYQRCYFDKQMLQFILHVPDYGYTVSQQIKRGLLYAYDIGYKEAYVLNYDLEVTDKMVRNFDKNIKQSDSIILNYGDRDGVYLAWFALKIEPFLDKLKSISREDYLDQIKNNIVEGYMLTKIANENSLIISKSDWDGSDRKNPLIKTSIRIDRSVLNYMERDGYFMFIGHEIMAQFTDANSTIHSTEKRIDTGEQIIGFFNLSEDLSVEIYYKEKLINSSHYEANKSIDRFCRTYLSINHDQYRDNISDIKVIVNGELISRKYLEESKYNSILMLHE